LPVEYSVPGIPKEGLLPTIAALRHMIGYAGNDETGKTCHASRLTYFVHLVNLHRNSAKRRLCMGNKYIVPGMSGLIVGRLAMRKLINVGVAALALPMCAASSVAQAQDQFSYIRCVKTASTDPHKRFFTTFRFDGRSLYFYSEPSRSFVNFCAIQTPCKVEITERSIYGVFNWYAKTGHRMININRLTGAYNQVDTYEDANDPIYGAHPSTGTCAKTTNPELTSPAVPKF
jgi:hypothetical protein